MSTKARELSIWRRFLERCRFDLSLHIEKIQGVLTLEGYQKRVIGAVSRALAGKGKRRIAIKACHDVGKTFTMAKIALAIGSVFVGAKIITTAPTFTAVEQLLWSEMRHGHWTSRFPLGGRMLQTQWKIRDDWFAIGLSPAEDGEKGEGQGKSSGFQGYHGDLVVILFDEATGVPPKRWIQAEGMMTSHNVIFVAIGNPTSRGSPFFRCFAGKGSRAWEKISLSCFDSPNLIAAGITDKAKLEAELDRLREMTEDEQEARIQAYPVVQPKLLTTQWVIEKAIDWGLDHPLFVSKVLGEFPEEDDRALYGLGAVEAAQLRKPTLGANDRYSIGVDVARYGSDETKITAMHGSRVFSPKTLVKRSTTEVTGAVIAEIRAILALEVRPERICVCIDGTGVGSGVVDQLFEAQREKRIPDQVEIREVNFGEGFKHLSNETERAENEKLFSNRKAKLYWRLASDLKKNLCLPQDDIYLEELPTIIHGHDSKGRIVVESKDDYKKRTGRGSPDTTDSLALANEGQYAGGRVGTWSTPANAGQKSTTAPSRNSGDQW